MRRVSSKADKRERRRARCRQRGDDSHKQAETAPVAAERFSMTFLQSDKIDTHISLRIIGNETAWRIAKLRHRDELRSRRTRPGRHHHRDRYHSIRVRAKLIHRRVMRGKRRR